MRKIITLIVAAIFLTGISCTDNDDTLVNNEPNLIIKFKFDPNQVRLNNLGETAVLPANHAAQSPIFNTISAHYFELAPNAFTQLGSGHVVYKAPETTLGGNLAIDFSQAKIVSQNEAFISVPLSSLTQGSYEYVRVSLSYQEYDISILNSGTDYNGTIQSFLGYNTFITSHAIGNNFFNVNANKPQGYWAFALTDFPYASSGQAAAGATTVPNPIAYSSPIPAGSCVVTGKFPQNLVINGTQKKDIEITLSLSINNSFEWEEINYDGKYEPSAGETVVDMGIRGLLPTYKIN